MALEQIQPGSFQPKRPPEVNILSGRDSAARTASPEIERVVGLLETGAEMLINPYLAGRSPEQYARTPEWNAKKNTVAIMFDTNVVKPLLTKSGASIGTIREALVYLQENSGNPILRDIAEVARSRNFAQYQ
jgi:hypothetical protein